MNPEKSRNPIKKIIPKPIRRFITKVVIGTKDSLSSDYHLEHIAKNGEHDQLREQKVTAHLIGMSACNSLLNGEPASDQLLELKLALSELPKEVNIQALWFDERQLELLSLYFDIQQSPEE